MLKLLDTYIMKKYLQTFFFTVLLFSIVSIAVDFSEKIQKLIESEASAGSIVVDYFLPFLVFITAQVWPIYILISCIFFISRMAGNNEVLSMLNAGIPYHRIMKPFLMTSILLAGIHFVTNHYVLPQSEKKRLAFISDHLEKDKIEWRTNKVHQMLDANNKVFIQNFRIHDSAAYDVRFENFKEGKLHQIMTVRKMVYKGENQWRLYDWGKRTFLEKDQIVDLNHKGTIDTTLRINPSDFEHIKEIERTYNSGEILDEIAEQKSKGFVGTEIIETEFHRRTADAFTSILVTLIAFFISSRKVRGGIGIHLAMGIIIGAIYIFLSKMSITFAQSKTITPLLGVWIPNIIFSALAYFLYTRAQQ